MICTRVVEQRQQLEKRTLKCRIAFSCLEVLAFQHEFNPGINGNLIDFRDRDKPICRKSKIMAQDEDELVKIPKLTW
jgi:hypothetical protein